MVKFPCRLADITSTRRKSPLELTFTTYLREKSIPKRMNNDDKNWRKKADCKREL